MKVTLSELSEKLSRLVEFMRRPSEPIQGAELLEDDDGSFTLLDATGVPRMWGLSKELVDMAQALPKEEP